MVFEEYKAINIQAQSEGWHHWFRISEAGYYLDPVEVEHCIAYTCPFRLDEVPMQVCNPNGMFIAELMAGGIHPPIEVLHNQKLRMVMSDDLIDRSSAEPRRNILPLIPEGATPLGGGFYEVICTKLEAPSWRARMRRHSEQVVDNADAHLTVAMPMSYRDALEFVMMKDVPFECWGLQHNKPMVAIVPRTALPSDRTHRNEWRLKDLAA